MASIIEAHAALLRDGTLQFDLPKAAALDPPSKPMPFPWLPSPGFGNVNIVWILAALGAALAIGLALAYIRNSQSHPTDRSLFARPSLHLRS